MRLTLLIDDFGGLFFVYPSTIQQYSAPQNSAVIFQQLKVFTGAKVIKGHL